MAVGTGFHARTGRYGQVLTGRDGRGRFWRWDGTVEAGFVDVAGREGDFPRRDGTVKCNGRVFLDVTGRDEVTVGEVVKATGRDGATVPI